MKKIIRMLLIITLLISSKALFCAPQKSPQLTIIMIADQFAYSYITKLRNNFKHGLKRFLDQGIVYENAFHAHGSPETAPGHHALSTGTLPKDHGVIGNDWFNKQGKRISYGNDYSEQAPVFKNGDTYEDKFKSPRLTRVDGLSDQFALLSTDNKKNKVFSITIKPRAGIAVANRLGKAFWFDYDNGGFTSSKKYFDEMPSWAKEFNDKNFKNLKSVTWKTFHPEDSEYYKFPQIKNYQNSSFDFSMIERKEITIDRSKKKPFDLYLKTPNAGEKVFELGKICLENNFKPDENDRMILWLCISNLDLLGHFYGPDSFEVIDLLYHLDKQIGDFMSYVENTYGKENTLFAFTSDHGVQPIQEVMQAKGLTQARRILAKPLVKKMNEMIAEKYGIVDIVRRFYATYFNLDREKLEKLNKDMQNKILGSLKEFLSKQEGIRKVWTRKELEKACFEPHQKESFYKTQIYKDHFGDLICMPHPYCLISHYPKGCSHSTPYDYDTHVPLMILGNEIPRKRIRQTVWAGQLPVTIARLLHVPRPSASTYSLLPGIFE